ncbi:MAG: peptidase dimerization domain-containing protein, partial [Actinomycetota bacterium]
MRVLAAADADAEGGDAASARGVRVGRGGVLLGRLEADGVARLAGQLDEGRGGCAVAAAERILAAAPPAVANVGVVEGGSAVNAIAERASLLLDLRHVDPALVEQALGRVERAARTAPVAGIATAVEVVGRRPGGDGAASMALVELAREARDAVGLEAAEEHPASTDANAASGRGIPALGVGVSRGE